VSAGWWVLIGIGIALGLVVVYDLVQRRHAILRNFPLIGHLRYTLEAFGPELRQYIVTSNDEERPFSRNERRWVYASAKRENNYFAFGTDVALDHEPGHLIISPAAQPVRAPDGGDDPRFPLPCAKVLGEARGRRGAFRPESVVNLAGMSYGSLGARAVEALNAGAGLARCLHNTGEGGISSYHLNGGDLIFQIGTGYFGCRDSRGRFDLSRLTELVAMHPVRALEIKLSQGAKPGTGGILPGRKVTREIARIRGIPEGRDCQSPPAHSAFRGPDGLLDWVERIADATGLPVGVKSAVGQLGFWEDLADLMRETGRGVDFIDVDGGEGGTGAAPLAFADHVSLPFRLGMARLYPVFAERGLQDDIVFIGAGRLGLPETGLAAFALGCDMVGVAREAMLAIGCVQAQRCHTGRCPTGVTTSSWWLQRGLDPELKSVRLADYVITLRRELLALSRVCGVTHPALVALDRLELLDGERATNARERYGYAPGWGLPCERDRDRLLGLLRRAEEARAPVPPVAR
jgi:glutamate synthase domain-containing protein 2